MEARLLAALCATLIALPVFAGTSTINGELKELPPGTMIIDQVTLPLFVGAPDAVAASVWSDYYPPRSGMPIHERALTTLAIPDQTSSSFKVTIGRRALLKSAKDVFLPIGPISYRRNEFGGVDLFQDIQTNRFVIGDSSSLVCSRVSTASPRIYCVRLRNVGKLTAPVRGVRVPLEMITRVGLGHSAMDQLIGGVIVTRQPGKTYEENGALVVDALAKKFVIMDPQQGVVITGNVDMDVRAPGQAVPAHWVKP